MTLGVSISYISDFPELSPTNPPPPKWNTSYIKIQEGKFHLSHSGVATLREHEKKKREGDALGGRQQLGGVKLQVIGEQVKLHR